MATITRFVDTAATAGGNGVSQDHTDVGGNRAYADLAEWESAENTDLTDAGGDVMQVHCAGSSEDTTAVTIVGWTTSAASYIQIQGDTTAPDTDGDHPGYWDTGKYILHITSGNALTINEEFVRLKRFQINVTGPIGNGVNVTDMGATNDIQISEMLIRGGPVTGGGIDHAGVKVREPNAGNANVTMWNCVIFNWFNSSFPDTTVTELAGVNVIFGDVVAHNCTVYQCVAGFKVNSTYTITANNCISACDELNTNRVDFTGGGTLAGNFNCDNDNTAPGANSIQKTNAQIKFVSTTETNAGYLALDTGSACIGVGTDDPGSGLFSDDIRGDIRTSTWDIGADENVAGGGGTDQPWPDFANPETGGPQVVGY